MSRTDYQSSPERLEELLKQSHAIVDNGIRQMVTADRRKVAAICVLYSGGNDSTTLAHIFKDRADFAIHANTTIGVERTRQFVRDTCAAWGLPLIEEVPPTPYEDLVIDQGFPGPAMHFKMYQRLKERCLEQARNKLVENPFKERVVYLAGRRRNESARRADIPEMDRKGSIVFISPLVEWRKEDLELYRQTHDVPLNPASAGLGMSGECLCGAFAQPGEYDRVRDFDPDVALQILELEERVKNAWGNSRGANLRDWHLYMKRAAEARAKGDLGAVFRHLAFAARRRRTLDAPRFPEHACKWGWGAYKNDPSSQKPKTGPLCSSCDARWQPPVSAERSVELTAAIERVRARRLARLSGARVIVSAPTGRPEQPELPLEFPSENKEN